MNIARKFTFEEAMACSLAGSAVVAYHFGIEVEDLWLSDDGHVIGSTGLVPLEKWWDSEVEGEFSCFWVGQYVKAILGGPVARLMMAKRAKSEGRRLSTKRLAAKHSKKTDLAFGLIFAHMGEVDDGNTETTFHRLWDETQDLMSADIQQQRLSLMTDHLLEFKGVGGSELDSIFGSISA